MGLNFRIIIDDENYERCEAQWSYIGFNRFRESIAKHLVTLHQSFPLVEWDTVEDDIKDLLNHSDYDGDLTWEQCKVIAPRLEELANESGCLNESVDKPRALALVEAMKRCVELKGTLEFC